MQQAIEQAVGRVQASSEVPGPRDDRVAVMKIFEVVRELQRAERTGENSMSSVDKNFIMHSNVTISRGGFVGGVVGGGATWAALRNARNWIKFPSVLCAWMCSSVVGRVWAIDSSFQELFRKLPEDSQVRSAALKVVDIFGEQNGRLVSRYNLSPLLMNQADAGSSGSPDLFARGLDGAVAPAGSSSDDNFDMKAYFEKGEHQESPDKNTKEDGSDVSNANVDDAIFRDIRRSDPFREDLQAAEHAFQSEFEDEAEAIDKFGKEPTRSWDDVREEFYRGSSSSVERR